MDNRLVIITAVISVLITLLLFILAFKFGRDPRLKRILVVLAVLVSGVVIWGWKHYTTNAIPYLGTDDEISRQ